MEKIVVVDDEKLIRGIYKKLLTDQGYEVYEAASADHANEIVKHKKAGLVLLDLKMPVVDGNVLFEVLQALHSRTKVIIASVYPLEQQRRLAPGANDYYDKSQGLGVLLKKIKKII